MSAFNSIRPEQYDDLFKSAGQCSETLNPIEAIVAIAILAMGIDHQSTAVERADIERFLNQQPLTVVDRQLLYEKVQQLVHTHEPGAVFNAAHQALTPDQAEQAFVLAARVVLADAALAPEENNFLLALSQALALSNDQVTHLIQVALQDETALEEPEATTPGADSRLRRAVLDFFTRDDWPWEEVPDQAIVKTSYQGERGAWTCYARLRDQAQQIAFYSICPLMTPEVHYGAMSEFLTRANYGLIIGNFELDFRDGEIRYKTSIDVENAPLSFDLLKNLTYANVLAMDRYLPGIIAVLGGADPAAAVAQVEDLDLDDSNPEAI